MSIFIEKVLKVSEMLRLQLLLFLSCSEKIKREGGRGGGGREDWGKFTKWCS